MWDVYRPRLVASRASDEQHRRENETEKTKSALHPRSYTSLWRRLLAGLRKTVQRRRHGIPEVGSFKLPFGKASRTTRHRQHPRRLRPHAPGGSWRRRPRPFAEFAFDRRHLITRAVVDHRRRRMQPCVAEHAQQMPPPSESEIRDETLRPATRNTKVFVRPIPSPNVRKVQKKRSLKPSATNDGSWRSADLEHVPLRLPVSPWRFFRAPLDLVRLPRVSKFKIYDASRKASSHRRFLLFNTPC